MESQRCHHSGGKFRLGSDARVAARAVQRNGQVAEAMVRMLAGFEVKIDPVTRAKEERAHPFAG